uniref:Terminase small subunit n=1 Tax=Lactobacillus phage G2-Guo TaxID=3155564 RepID=A0AAU7PFQ9_9VIRU
MAKYFYEQNDGKISAKPPAHLGKIAGECWRKIVPFLESTRKVQRIDTSLVEMYCVEYEIYRNCYEDIKENGIQAPIKRSVQNSAGEIIGEDFTGWRKNPATATMKDTVGQLNQIGIQLGLTPKGRQELMTIADSSQSETTEDALKKFFGTKGDSK